MMKLLLCFLVVLHLTTAVPAGQQKSYEGYQVLGTRPVRDNAEVNALWSLLENPQLMPWNKPSVGREAFIMTSPQQVSHLTQLLSDLNMQPYTSIQNMETVLEQERNEIAGIKGFRTTSFQPGNVTFDTYMELHEIEEYLDEVVLRFPEVASLEVIGTSFEGRPLRVLKLSSSQNSSKPAVFIDAAIHAREWLSPPTALHVVYQLTIEAERNRNMLEAADWYILPVANPDGYLFSWENDRFWRKNRRPNNNSTCIGTDLNRNFDIAWTGTGVFSDPCSNWYSGLSANSEPETKAIADFLTLKREQLSLYIAIHSHGSYLLYPFGYKTESPNTLTMYAAEKAASEVKTVRGTEFEVGSIANVLYFAYGSSQDFAYGKLNITYAYTWELPSGGSQGFDAPSSEIRPVVEELWVGIKVLFDHALNKMQNISVTEEIFTETTVTDQSVTSTQETLMTSTCSENRQ